MVEGSLSHPYVTSKYLHGKSFLGFRWHSLLTYYKVLHINSSKATKIRVSWKVIYEP